MIHLAPQSEVKIGLETLLGDLQDLRIPFIICTSLGQLWPTSMEPWEVQWLARLESAISTLLVSTQAVHV